MNATEIIMQYHGQVNKIYAEEAHRVVASSRAHSLFQEYSEKLRYMVKGGTMTKEEYHHIGDAMIAINASKYFG